MTSVDERGDEAPKAHRATYREAGEAMREAMGRLATVRVRDRRRQTWWQIVADAIVLVGSYSKTRDYGVVKVLAERHEVSTDTVGRALAWGHEVGAIRWERVGTRWWLSLPEAEEATPHIEGTSAESDTAHRGGICGVSEKTPEKNRGRTGAALVAVMADAARAVSPAAADWIGADAEVADLADVCVAAGLTGGDVRRALAERQSTRIDHGPRWAIAVLRRLRAGEALPVKRGRNSRPSGSRHVGPKPHEEWEGESSQALTRW